MRVLAVPPPGGAWREARLELARVTLKVVDERALREALAWVPDISRETRIVSAALVEGAVAPPAGAGFAASVFSAIAPGRRDAEGRKARLSTSSRLGHSPTPTPVAVMPSGPRSTSTRGRPSRSAAQ